MKKKISIGIADDHIFVRQGLISLLKEFDTINVLFDVSNGKELLDMLKEHKPDIVLLDLEMPIIDGREAFDRMKSKYPGIRIIILSTHYKDSYIIEFIKKGAASFLSKNSGIEKVMEALTEVYNTGQYYDKEIAKTLAKAISYSPQPAARPGLQQAADLNLTDREIIIVRMLCKGHSNADIADGLGLSVRTVEGHRLHIRQKTGCKTQLELNTFAANNRLLEDQA